MCYTVYVPIICTLQMITRVLVTILYAAEDLIRLVIHTCHSYISMCLQFFSIIPMCLAFCVVKQCYCSGLCSSGCNPSSGTSCGCTLVIVVVIIIFIIFFFTNWFEDLLRLLRSVFPCDFFLKQRNNILNYKDSQVERTMSGDRGSANKTENNFKHKYYGVKELARKKSKKTNEDELDKFVNETFMVLLNDTEKVLEGVDTSISNFPGMFDNADENSEALVRTKEEVNKQNSSEISSITSETLTSFPESFSELPAANITKYIARVTHLAPTLL